MGDGIGICQKCKKTRKDFSPYNVLQFMFIWNIKQKKINSRFSLSAHVHCEQKFKFKLKSIRAFKRPWL
jgi:hypothetical protein